MATFFLFLFVFSHALCFSEAKVKGPITYLWPLPAEFTSGNETLSVDPGLSLVFGGKGGNSDIVRLAFDRYKAVIFKNSNGVSGLDRLRPREPSYDISKVRVVVHSESEEVRWVLFKFQIDCWK
jgi:hexosaminidase